AIVVRENIFRKLEGGINARLAAISGTKEVQLAVIATTMVVISVFAPVGMMSGVLGTFLRQFGFTICFAMLISLFDSLTIAPMLSTYLAINVHGDGDKKMSIFGRINKAVLTLFENFYGWLEAIYGRLLRIIVRHQLITIIASLVIFLICCGTLSKVPFTFMPESNNGQLAVTLELAPGASLDAMNNVGTQADEIIHKNGEVELTELKVGGSNNEAYKASIYVKLKADRPKSVTTESFKARIREQLAVLASANPKVNDYDATGGSQTQPLTVNLTSTSQEDLNEYAPKLIERLKNDKRLRDVDSSYRPGKPETQIKTNHEKAKIYGISTKTLGNEIRYQVEGATPAKYRENGQEYDIRVRLLSDQRDLSQNYQDIYIPNVNDRLIRLTDVADIKKETGAATIQRQDRGRYIEISAALMPGVGLGDVLKDVSVIIQKELPLPQGMRMMYAGESENYQEMMNSMLMAVGMGILFIYLVLASLYESFIVPFTIMLALPLAVCGAFVALFIANNTMNIFTLLGMIMLLGVACKNSILLVDYIGRLIKEGKEQSDAIITACKIRLRPILMTSFALIAGMIPVAIGFNASSSQRTSMGVAIIGGLVSSTLLTLIVIPAVFSYIDRFQNWIGNIIAKIVGYTEQNTK
ncbi:MAG: efflux RND transporter permease subunit, partial [Candidatus Omnitrophota bacterium]